VTSSELSQRSWTIARLTQHSAARFLITGGLTLAVDEGALFVLHGLLGLWLPAATTLAYAIAFGVNFGLGRNWAFSAREGAVGRQVGRYLLLVLFNLGVNVVGVWALTAAGLLYLLSKLIVAGVLAIFNYFVSRHWVFS
jgi:putative flippase GtrA